MKPISEWPDSIRIPVGALYLLGAICLLFTGMAIVAASEVYHRFPARRV